MIEVALMKITHAPSDTECGDTPKQKRAAGSLAARRALEWLYERKIGTRMPKITTDKYGKPHFVCEDAESIRFSLSHTDGYAAAVITDCGSIGIDIEEERDAELAERLTARYLKNVNINLHNKQNDIEIYLLKTEKTNTPCEIIGLEGDKRLTQLCGALTDGSRFENRWTALEAVLKADGRGFGAFAEIGRIADEIQVSSYTLDIDGEYLFLSVART